MAVGGWLLAIGQLLGHAAGMAVLAPVLLTRGAWRFERPGLALALWHLALHSGLAAAAGSLVVAMTLASALVEQHVAPVGGPWTPVDGVVLGWVGTGVAGVVGVVVATQSRRLAREESLTRRRLAALVAVRGIHRAVADDMNIIVVESDRALACALPGRDLGPGPRHRVIVSSGLARALHAGELRAVMLHELAHLRLHHPVLVRVARLNAACLPLLPGARELERVTGMLVELVADDVAVRRCGTRALARALTTIGTLESDPAMLLRAERLLRRPVPPRPTPPRPLLLPGRAPATGR